MADSTDEFATVVGDTSKDGLESALQIEQVDEEAEEKEKRPPAAPERDTWASKVSYILTLVGYAVGLGNLWRFPFVMKENGGLAFLIPYSTALAILGIPLFFMELAVGQRRRKGVVYAWSEICPWLGGLGITCGWLCFMVGLYYNTLIAYCMSYWIDSFRSPLPWKSCKVAANGEKDGIEECEDKLGGRPTKYYWFKKTLEISTGYEDIGGYNWKLFAYHIVAWIAIYLILIKGTKWVGKIVYFTALYPYVVLFIFLIANFCIEPAKGWHGAYRLLYPKWELLGEPETWLKAGSQIFFSIGVAYGCLIVFASFNPERNNCYKDAISISLINSASSLFAALVVFPIVGLLGHKKYRECWDKYRKLFPNANFAKESTYEKYYDIYFYTEAKDWDDVMNKEIKIGYNYGELSEDERKDFLKFDFEVKPEIIKYADLDTNVITTLKNSGTGIEYINNQLCSIGYEATASGGGSGFVFQAFTEAVLQMPGSNFWAFLFFTMLIFLGIDSGFGTVEGAIAAIQDLTHFKRWISTSIVVGVLTVLALLIFPFGWGNYALNLIDQFTANWTFMCVALLECIAVSWSYGLAKFSYDIHLMTGKKPNLYMILCWKYISPIAISVMLIGSVWQHFAATAKSGNEYTAYDPKHKDSASGDVTKIVPGYAVAIGFLLLLFCLIWIPIHAILRKTKFNMLKDEAPSDFPEEELRDERNIHVEKEEDQFTNVEKAIMGRRSILDLQQLRDEKKSKSQASVDMTKSSSKNDKL